MNISIFGLGYVGAVCAGCLSARGHQVLGVDVAQAKIDMINQGRSPIVEPGLEQLLLDGVRQGRLRGTTDVQAAILATELSLLCVGTPSKANGDLDLVYMEAVCREIGAALRDKASRHTVVVRSTVLPGTVKNVVIPLLEQASGKQAGRDFGVAVNPEFLRESTAIQDYDFPAMTVIGELDSRSGDLLASLYQGLDAPVIRKSIEVAELIKYTCNVWHATKVSFANEIGNIAKASGVDGREVMDVVCQDYKLNLSRYYLRPGFAFGGSCLPKDVRALTYRASQLDVAHPLLGSIMASNRNQVANALDLVTQAGKRRIALLGLAFKANSDDLRESPLVTLAEQLIGKGYELRIFDANVDHARQFGANRQYIEQQIPHVSALLRSDLQQVIDEAEVIVLGNNDERFVQALDAGKQVIDLVGFMADGSNAQHHGICW
ncbi:UDP-glucose/GDP-mannose dehydrogenase family protein [Pseudomonas soli]|uniref:GDP-mannose 6-dehydrogenase n=1 Tax=Pseudomonas soli TaxID=1306993 RepID=A0A1H9L6I4_9PSED|nr:MULTISPECIES: UDP-glucose/GDP-mannose dehydrogenase family protein [Pseudomonas]AIN59151.1 GDP-mannose dehydrogenase [Pseudomonas soli]MCX5507137.1 UDP-glucose/GDP-mannose dehydrogenase family protein [Pseudomonas sp. BJa3]MDT3715086.1 UDP-glucose/GDP-mannose dehydrogenase family protein [Pseudomonas soli]MDT3731499.1 UDP-glucose/GDP-mannose dehydrogenase family protein [Pseudomonas soli]MEE1879733.1 UDP-glucose/GDP-mannose dehydrogenase family protein [Pseudomonas soli]